MKIAKGLVGAGLMVTIVVQSLGVLIAPKALAQDIATELANGSFATFAVEGHKGMKVTFDNAGLQAVTNVAVDLYQNNRKLATNTGTQSLYNLINTSETPISTLFYTQGTVNDPYWESGVVSWLAKDKPTHATVTVASASGTQTTILSPLTETDAAFESLITDTAPPSVPVNGSPNASLLNAPDVAMTWQAANDNSGQAPTYVLEYTQDSAFTTGLYSQQGESNPSMQLSGLADGTWYWHVRAVDDSGNASPWSQTWAVTVDTRPPQITHDLAADTRLEGQAMVNTVVTDSSSVSWELNVYLVSDLAKSLFRSTNASSIFDTTQFQDGNYIAMWIAADQAGNQISTGLPFKIDNKSLLAITQGDRVGEEGVISKVELVPLFFSPLQSIRKAPATDQLANIDIAEPVNNTKSVASKVPVPHVIDDMGTARKPTQLEATQAGWKLFGFAWYWWLLGGGVSGIMIRQLVLKRNMR